MAERNRARRCLLAEFKAPDDKFPLDTIQAAGYGAIWRGQKSWNGVATLARGVDPMETRRSLQGNPQDDQSRYIKAAIDGVLIGCMYVPNGNPAPGPRFDFKLRWLDQFTTHARQLIDTGEPVVLAGDYNVMPTDLDVCKPERWVDDALFRPEVREAFHALLQQSWIDAVRRLHPDERIYTVLGLPPPWPDARRRLAHRPSAGQPRPRKKVGDSRR